MYIIFYFRIGNIGSPPVTLRAGRATAASDAVSQPRRAASPVRGVLLLRCSRLTYNGQLSSVGSRTHPQLSHHAKSTLNALWLTELTLTLRAETAPLVECWVQRQVLREVVPLSAARRRAVFSSSPFVIRQDLLWLFHLPLSLIKPAVSAEAMYWKGLLEILDQSFNIFRHWIITLVGILNQRSAVTQFHLMIKSKNIQRLSKK